jgi:hypothetical protein
VTTLKDFPGKEFRAAGGPFKGKSTQIVTMLRTYLVT